MTLTDVALVRSMLLGCFGGNMKEYQPIPSKMIPHPSAIGVVRVVIQAANIKKRLFKPRPFVLIRVQGRSETRTTTREIKTHSPNWFSESTNILIVYTLQEDIDFKILNHHRFMRRGVIGHSVFPLILLKDEPRRIGEEKPILDKNNKTKGTTLFDVFYYPVSMSSEVASSAAMGVVTLRIQRARDLKWDQYAKKPRKLLTVTSLGWSEEPIHKSEASYHPDFPVWNSVFDFLCYDKSSTVLVIKIVEKHNAKNPVVYGHLSLGLDDLIGAQDEKREWWPLSGCPDGELRVTAEWKPIEMDRNSIYISS